MDLPLDIEGAATSPDSLPQIQQRLLQLAGQIDQMQSQLEQLTADTRDNNSQLDALLRAFLSPSNAQKAEERLSDIAAQLTDTHQQVEQIKDALAVVATREQVALLEHALVDREMVAEVADNVKKLGRTQFKANTLGETREQQIENALALARDLVVRREQAQERRSADDRLRLDELRNAARGELAADLLPALDSIELALAAGRSLVAQRRKQLDDWRERHAAQLRSLSTPQEAVSVSEINPPIGFWERLRRSLSSEASLPQSIRLALPPPAASEPAPEIENASDLLDAIESWLSGLALVRDRFAALLSLEEIQPLPALGQPFDPRLHLAIEAEERSDAPANTVVRVLRQGYRQRQRVLRYAEVVVARPPSVAAEMQPDQSAYDKEENDDEQF
jgi:molecular chaperone GrpE (heat shock protein)